MVVWIIGLSGAGKTTLANEVVEKLRADEHKVALLDGDVIRDIFGNDLGHSLEDRKKNADRICQLGAFLESQGITVVTAILSIFPESRAWNRENLQNYFEVFIDTPTETLIERDSKGLYKRFLNGDIKEVAGMDLDFPRPENADMTINNIHSKEELLAFSEPIIAAIKESTK